MPETHEEPGALIRRYRTERRLMVKELAGELKVSPSFLSRIEQGQRELKPDLAARAADVLQLSDEERARLYRSLGPTQLAGDLYRLHRHELERRWIDAGRDAFDRITRRVTRPTGAFRHWVLGRLYVGRFEVARAIPLLEKAASMIERAPQDLVSIVLIDLADAYAIAGRLDEADRLSERAVERTWRLVQQDPSQLHWMDFGRALVMRQEVAYERGDEANCQAFHAEARQPLANAGDAYGDAKSFFFLALFRFWQGRLDEAAKHAVAARAAAERIPPRFGLWWGLRDGFFLGSHWWRPITESVQLDVQACRGLGNTGDEDRFDVLLLTHRGARHWWTPDFPPFVPRYWWLGNPTMESLNAAEAELVHWVEETKRGGCLHLHTDLLLCRGDFLRTARRDHSGAQRVYREALAIAREPRHGYGLLALAAERRLAGDVVFPGLVRFGRV